MNDATPSVRCYALAIIARSQQASDPNKALASTNEALAILETLEGLEEGDIFVRVVFAEILLAAGDRERARTIAVEAARRVRDRTQRMGREELRKAFLENVPENARALELAAQLSTT
jgi:hypothetical protein